jgi:hypothetical protein
MLYERDLEYRVPNLVCINFSSLFLKVLQKNRTVMTEFGLISECFMSKHTSEPARVTGERIQRSCGI